MHEDTPIGDGFETRDTLGDATPPTDAPLEGLSSADCFETSERPGEVIGNYKLLEQIGEGGFGVVYLAEQERPVRRRVALKILKMGMDTKRVIARFEAERQALAMMDHPCIAKVLDAGATQNGRPYFVMELVRGVPITDYCDRNNLCTDERLRLFIDVCHAVQHAHQKGVIHRDLKPSNILVGVQDDKPQPKVIDFGIAKATTQPLTEQTVYTMQRQLIGTPEYMSPEQAEMTGLDIDTRSDIYSLGVILYELLTGGTPFDAMTLRSASFHELPRLLREKDPPIPSTRLASMGEQAEVVARHRREALSQLTRSLRGDLDWITMKAMEKDRTRRYDTANALAADIERHLKNEPVLASPPSTVYRFQKFARRNKALLGAVSCVAAALVVGLGVATYGFVSASLERDQKEAARAQAVLALDREALARQESEAARAEAVQALASEAQARQESEAVTEFLADMLSAVDPARSGRDVTVSELLNQAAIGIGSQFQDRPRIEARLRQTIGDTYVALSEYDKAQAQLPEALELRRRELGEDAPDTLRTMSSIADLLTRQDRYAEAEATLLQTLDAARRVLGEDHPDTLAALHRLGVVKRLAGDRDEAERLFTRALSARRRVLGEDHRDTLRSAHALAHLWALQANYDKAEEAYAQILPRLTRVFGPAHPDTLSMRKDLAALHRQLGRYSEAESHYKETLEIQRRVLGEDHHETLRTLNNLAGLVLDQGRHADAEGLFLTALEISGRVLGESHTETASVMSNLAQVYNATGRAAEAEQLHREALAIRRRDLGADHPSTLSSAASLASTLRRLGRPADAEPLLTEALTERKRVLGEEHPSTLATMVNLSSVYSDLKRYADAERILLEALPIQKRVLGESHPNTLALMINLGAAYREQGRHAEAAPVFEEALRLCRDTLGAAHRFTAAARANLVMALTELRRWTDIEPIRREEYELAREANGAGHQQTLDALQTLVEARLSAGMDLEARDALRSLLSARRTAADAEGAHPVALMQYAYLALTCKPEDMRDYDAALAYARRACEATEDADPDAMQLLAMALHATADNDAAVLAQRRAVELLRDDPDALAEAMETLSMYEGAGRGGE